MRRLNTSLPRRTADDHVRYQVSLRQLLEPYAGKLVMVHSDLFHASPFVPRTTDRERALQTHRDFLGSLGVRLRVAAFNYQFARDSAVDLRSAAVEVGPLGDFMLRNWATERTFDPIFSFLSGENAFPGPAPDNGLFVAFGERSLFPDIPADDGAILMYGANLTSLTMLHLAELVASEPLYRYDKDFAGSAIDWYGRTISVCYRYHVRPLGRHLAYDWGRLQELLIDAGVLRWIYADRRSVGLLLDARTLVETLVTALRNDPLWLLDAESRAWVAPEIQRLGRRFVISDFEPQPPG